MTEESEFAAFEPLLGSDQDFEPSQACSGPACRLWSAMAIYLRDLHMCCAACAAGRPAVIGCMPRSLGSVLTGASSRSQPPSALTTSAAFRRRQSAWVASSCATAAVSCPTIAAHGPATQRKQVLDGEKYCVPRQPNRGNKLDLHEQPLKLICERFAAYLRSS